MRRRAAGRADGDEAGQRVAVARLPRRQGTLIEIFATVRRPWQGATVAEPALDELIAARLRRVRRAAETP